MFSAWFVYEKAHFKGFHVYPTDTKLYGVGDHPLPAVGKLLATVKVGSHSASTHFYVVDMPTNEGLLGLDALSSLTIEPVSGKLASVALAEKTPKLPTIVGYKNHIKLKPDTVSMQIPLQQLPLSILADVSNELQCLLQADIIERTEASQWISPVVVAFKKSGGICLCMGLQGSNSQIIAEVHPLPTVNP